jgi:1,4-dihydroxy-2-naphthoate octaprenyltransferase
VRTAAFLAFGVAGLAGLVLAATTAWWLVAVGAVCVVAAWFYTGGSKPYGYLGLGEVMVFVFFGLVAVLGTQYVQAERLTAAGWYAACGIGALACAILVANNLRDIPTDRGSGKITLAVRLGDERTRICYGLLLLLALVALVGAVSVAAAWFYTGGSKPYGYLGLGEIMVFVFFGLVAVLGTQYVQAETLTLGGLYAACGIGALACAILVANNLRDIPTDRVAGKLTLAVRLGDARTRALYVLLVLAALVALLGIALETSWWALLAVAYLLPAARATTVVRRATGRDLVPALQLTGVAELVYGLGLFVGLVAG